MNKVEIAPVSPEGDQLVPLESQLPNQSTASWLRNNRLAKYAVAGLGFIGSISAIEAALPTQPAQAACYVRAKDGTIATCDSGTPGVVIDSGNPSPVLRRWDFNMHDFGNPITSNGCGMAAGATAVSFVTQRKVNPRELHRHSHKWYSPNGVLHGSPYMNGAAKHWSKVYNFREYRTDLAGAKRAVKHGAAVIMLAAGGPGNPITHASHYFESDELKNGEFVIHDPNQTSTRNFDKSQHSIQWLRSHGTLNEAWVFMPKNRHPNN